MASSSFQVTTYNYYSWSSRNTTRTNLNLKGSGGKVCFVNFKEDSVTDLPPATNSGNYYWFYYRESQLEHLIDMLRNEGPVYVHFNDNSGFNNSRIATTDEPVGEGEIS
ncbi:MAG: hypothetical protein OQJ83_08330 [Altibacter sp.]|uniref:hypothetical protein n=1 Tax=Altibacter lentus TaxID=1223410 RepID=UPI000555BBBE|nr:hypothetical protein [Altibacter lentus]MCW8981380.1 hypothetical protein [Altibacter sp.]